MTGWAEAMERAKSVRDYDAYFSVSGVSCQRMVIYLTP